MTDVAVAFYFSASLHITITPEYFCPYPAGKHKPTCQSEHACAVFFSPNMSHLQHSDMMKKMNVSLFSVKGLHSSYQYLSLLSHLDDNRRSRGPKKEKILGTMRPVITHWAKVSNYFYWIYSYFYVFNPNSRRWTDVNLTTNKPAFNHAWRGSQCWKVSVNRNTVYDILMHSTVSRGTYFVLSVLPVYLRSSNMSCLFLVHRRL